MILCVSYKNAESQSKTIALAIANARVQYYNLPPQGFRNILPDILSRPSD